MKIPLSNSRLRLELRAALFASIRIHPMLFPILLLSIPWVSAQAGTKAQEEKWVSYQVEPYVDSSVTFREAKFLESSSGLLTYVSGAILRRSRPKGILRWEIAAMGIDIANTWMDDLSFQNGARGMIALGPRLEREPDNLDSEGPWEIAWEPRVVMQSLNDGIDWQALPLSQAHGLGAVAGKGLWWSTSFDPPEFLMASGNQGKTWRNVKVEIPGYSYKVMSVKLLDPDGPWLSASGPTGGEYVLHSPDGGKTWKDRTPPGSNTIMNPFFREMGGLHFLLGDTCLYVTSDFGGSWQKRPLPDIHLSRNEYKLTASQSRLWLSTDLKKNFVSSDGGQNWIGLTWPYAEGELWAQGRHVVLEKKDGTLFVSDDQGQSWEEINLKPLKTVWKGQWRGQGWAATNYGLYRTSDWGRRWRRQDLGSSQAKIDVIQSTEILRDTLFIKTSTGTYYGSGEPIHFLQR